VLNLFIGKRIYFSSNSRVFSAEFYVLMHTAYSVLKEPLARCHESHSPPEFRRIALRSEDMSERREMGLFDVGASNRNRTLWNNPKKPWNRGIFCVCVEFRVEYQLEGLNDFNAKLKDEGISILLA